MALTITDSEYNRILTAIGYPIVSVTDVGLTDEQVKTLFIEPVLTEVYSVFFPKKAYSQYSIGSTFSIDFPDEYTIGVVDTRLNTFPEEGAAKTASPLINQLNITIGGRSQKMWGTPNDYGYSQVKIFQKMEAEAQIQDNKAFSVRVNREDRVLEGYTNTYGEMSVTWAKYIEDWAEIQYRFKKDARELAQARLMEYLGRIWEQTTGNLPEDVDGSGYLSAAEDIRTRIMEKWQNYSKVVLLR